MRFQSALNRNRTANPFKKTLADGTTVEFVAVAKYAKNTTDSLVAWIPGGDTLPAQKWLLRAWKRSFIPNVYQSRYTWFVIQVNGKQQNIRACQYTRGKPVPEFVRGICKPSGRFVGVTEGITAYDKSDFLVGVPRTKWEYIMAGQMLRGLTAKHEHTKFSSQGNVFQLKASIENMRDTKAGACFSIRGMETRDSKGRQTEAKYQFYVETTSGKKVYSEATYSPGSGTVDAEILFRGVPMKDVFGYRIFARPYDWVTFSGVALQPKPKPALRWKAFAKAPFEPRRTFRETISGKAVVFTVETAPETNGQWSRSGNPLPYAIVMSHDTDYEMDGRRFVLVEKNGTRHVLEDGWSFNSQTGHQALWEKAMGKPVVFGRNRYQGVIKKGEQQEWVQMQAQFPKAWIPRLKEIHLESVNRLRDNVNAPPSAKRSAGRLCFLPYCLRRRNAGMSSASSAEIVAGRGGVCTATVGFSVCASASPVLPIALLTLATIVGDTGVPTGRRGITVLAGCGATYDFAAGLSVRASKPVAKTVIRTAPDRRGSITAPKMIFASSPSVPFWISSNASLTSESVKSEPAVTLTKTDRAPEISVSSSGDEIAICAASTARWSPSAKPMPIKAVPASDITALTSAKSTLISPGIVMMSEMP